MKWIVLTVVGYEEFKIYRSITRYFKMLSLDSKLKQQYKNCMGGTIDNTLNFKFDDR